MKQEMDEVVARGVPQEAARDFLPGHMNMLATVPFERVERVFSDVCCKAIENGPPLPTKDDCKRVFDPDEIATRIERIT